MSLIFSAPRTLGSRMRHRIDKDCPIAQKAPRNGSVVKKVLKKHGKGKPSTVKMTRILQHLPNHAASSGSDQSDSAQSDSILFIRN